VCLLLLAVSAHTANALLLPTQQQQPFTLNGAKTLTLMFRLKPLQQQPTPPPAYTNAPMNRWDFTGGDGYLLVTRGDMGPLIGVLSEMMWFPGRFRPKCSNQTFFSAQRFWVDLPISQQIGRTYWGFPKVSIRHNGWKTAMATGLQLQLTWPVSQGLCLPGSTWQQQRFCHHWCMHVHTTGQPYGFASCAQHHCVKANTRTNSKHSFCLATADSFLPLLLLLLLQELAEFKWTSTSVAVKDPSTGKTFFSASLTAAAAAGRELPTWFPTFVQRGFSTLQWPIKDARINVANVLDLDLRVQPSTEDTADAAAEAADAATESLLAATSVASAADVTAAAATSDVTALVPNRQMLRFPVYTNLVLTKALDVTFDSFVFTGRQTETVALVDTKDVGFVRGSPGQLDNPKSFTCKRAAAGQR
jgi:hypothetical protein